MIKMNKDFELEQYKNQKQNSSKKGKGRIGILSFILNNY